MSSNLIALGVFLGVAVTAIWGTRKVVRGGPWVERIRPAVVSLHESAFASSRHPAVRFQIEERRKQATIRTDQAQGDPPNEIDLDAGTVSLPRPTTGP